jgi:hypothetical protein
VRWLRITLSEVLQLQKSFAYFIQEWQSPVKLGINLNRSDWHLFDWFLSHTRHDRRRSQRPKELRHAARWHECLTIATLECDVHIRNRDSRNYFADSGRLKFTLRGYPDLLRRNLRRLCIRRLIIWVSHSISNVNLYIPVCSLWLHPWDTPISTKGFCVIKL